VTHQAGITCTYNVNSGQLYLYVDRNMATVQTAHLI